MQMGLPDVGFVAELCQALPHLFHACLQSSLCYFVTIRIKDKPISGTFGPGNRQSVPYISSSLVNHDIVACNWASSSL